MSKQSQVQKQSADLINWREFDRVAELGRNWALLQVKGQDRNRLLQYVESQLWMFKVEEKWQQRHVRHAKAYLRRHSELMFTLSQAAAWLLVTVFIWEMFQGFGAFRPAFGALELDQHASFNG